MSIPGGDHILTSRDAEDETRVSAGVLALRLPKQAVAIPQGIPITG